MTKLRLPFLIDQGTAASKQVIAWQDGAQERAQRCGALSAQRAEAAHLNSQVGAPICDAVVAERRRAASDGVGEPSRARARRRHTFGPSPWHGYMCGPCHCRGPHVTRGRARAAEGPPACSPLERRVCFASPPYTTTAGRRFRRAPPAGPHTLFGLCKTRVWPQHALRTIRSLPRWGPPLPPPPLPHPLGGQACDVLFI